VRFELLYTAQANLDLDRLESNPSQAQRLRKVRRTLGLMETNLRHPSLNTHKYEILKGAGGEEVFESYVENRTPAAFRVFWHYGPAKQQITILAVTPHP